MKWTLWTSRFALSLNPCSNGITIELAAQTPDTDLLESLNPCSNGITIEFGFDVPHAVAVSS